MTSNRGFRSEAERDFTDSLVSAGLVEGTHYRREHRFARRFHDREMTSFGIRVDFWFPQWRIVVEVKRGPLGRKHGTKVAAKAESQRLREAHEPNYKCIRVDWSNQLEKFLCVAEQAGDDPETEGILWLIVDDGQMSGVEAVRKQYTRHNRRHQVHEFRRRLRRGYGFNPMGQGEAIRLLSRFRQLDDLTPEAVYDPEWLESLPVFTQVAYKMRVENTRLQLLNSVHEYDTLEDIIVDPESVAVDGDSVTINGGYVLLPACA